VSAPASPSPSPEPTPAPTPPARNPAAYVAGQTYAPLFDPAGFVAAVDNPYFPLTPGTTYVFEGGGEHNEVTVTHDTKTILGIPAVVVHDQVFVNGTLTEDTLDWFAQDRWGNVWYLGEATHTVKNGVVGSSSGSWEAGVDGALPGIAMLADPHEGDVYRQEYSAGHAEDIGTVVQIGGSETVVAGTYSPVLVTHDGSVIEPGVVEEKTYAPGIGFILERVVGGSGRLELLRIVVEAPTGG
jgi:hypothetical protein